MKKNLTYLIAAVAIMLLGSAANAQVNGLTPITGATHEYSVTAADATNNTLSWSVLEGSDGTEYDVNSGATSESVNITWNTAGTYTLQFSEEADGSGCITLRQETIVVSANTFDVSTSNPTAICNAEDGSVDPSGDATTTISFTVAMSTGRTDWSPDWEITFTLTPSGTSTIGTVSTSAGDLSEAGGTYTLTNLTSTNGGGTVTISMPVTEDVFTVQTTALAITSATELDYDTSDIDSDDWTATQTVNALPNTSAISAN